MMTDAERIQRTELYLEKITKDRIWRLLGDSNWSIPRAAVKFGISYRTLYRWLHSWDLFDEVQQQKLAAIARKIKK